MDKKIPDKVINRLTLYHCIISDFINNKEDVISSKQIAQLLNTDDSQVRKDINYLDNSGKSRVGYGVKELKLAIEKTLGFKKTKKAFIIGAGNLGTEIAKQDEVDIAILTVPRQFAQTTADFLVNSNIKYIWNFAPVVLSVPNDVQIWNENLMGNFLQFTYSI